MRTVPAFSLLATGPSFGRVVNRLAQRAAAILVVWRGRRAAAELAHLDARLLGDIGLTRSDVLGAIECSMRQDPTERLAHVARERRVADAAQKREAARCWQ